MAKATSLISRTRLTRTLSFRAGEFAGLATRDHTGRITITVGCQTHPLAWWQGARFATFVARMYQARSENPTRFYHHDVLMHEARVKRIKAQNRIERRTAAKILAGRAAALKQIERALR